MRAESSKNTKTNDDKGDVESSTQQMAMAAENHRKANSNPQSQASKSASSDMVTRSSTRKSIRDAAAAVATQSHRMVGNDQRLGVVSVEVSPKFVAPTQRRKQKQLKTVKAEPPLVQDYCDDNFESGHTSNSKVLMWLSSTNVVAASTVTSAKNNIINKEKKRVSTASKNGDGLEMENGVATIDNHVSNAKTVKPSQAVVNSGDGGEGKRRRRLRAFSKHWLDYPKVVIGVIDEVAAQCNEVDLKARLHRALNDHLIGQKPFSCCVDDYEVGCTTLRRYVNMVKTVLEYAMGADELPAEVYAFLTPDTEFAVLKSHINLSVAHCKRKSSEQSEDEPPVKVQRGKIDVDKKENLSKEVVKSKKISLSGLNKGDGESLQQQMILPLATPSASQQSSQISAVATQSATKMSSSSPFFPQAKTSIGRRLFRGTIVDLRAEVLKILEERMEDRENIDQLVDIATSAIVKEVSLRDGMERARLPLKMLLSAYALCGRFIALDKIELVDDNDQMVGAFVSTEIADASTMNVLPLALKANVSDGKENRPVNNSGEKMTKSAGHENSGSKKSMRTVKEVGGAIACDGSSDGNGMLGEFCGKLVNAFAKDRSDGGDLTQLKCAIDYMVQYGYKRSEDDKKQLRDLLEAVLIDGISVQSALDESPGLKRVVVTEYSKRCQKICAYLSSLSGGLDFDDGKTVAKKVEAFTKGLFL